MADRLIIQLATGGTLEVLAEQPEARELTAEARALGLTVQVETPEYYGEDDARGLSYTGPFLVRSN